MTIQISHHDDGKQGTFLLEVDGRRAGDMDYRWLNPETILIHHTGVDDAYQGQGLARKLVDAGVSFAREKGIRIVPSCSYVAAVFRKDKASFSDVSSQ